jgi:hypothetical protein
MSHLLNKKCYLGGPIEKCQEKKNWRPPVIEELTRRFGLDVFDPFSDPKQQWVADLMKAKADKDAATIKKITKRFVKKDLQVVQKSELHVAYVPAGVPTVGTVHEIVVSNMCKNPILLMCPDGKFEVPLWYWGYIPETHMFGSWEDMYAFLAEVEEGKHKDEFLWSYIYGLL